MPNTEFFADIFPQDYWSKIDRSVLVEDPQNFFGDHAVFDWLISTVRPEVIVEIGSWKGHSANFMADVCRREGLQTKIVCVDTFSGSSEHWSSPELREQLFLKNGRPTVLERFLGNTVARGNTDHIFPLPVDGGTAADLFRAYEAKADLVFIDAGHQYPMVMNDIRSWWPHLTERGTMFGDDYQMWMSAVAAHDFGKEMNIPVMVAMRKWIFMRGQLAGMPVPLGGQIRTEFDGWDCVSWFVNPPPGWSG